MKKSLRNALIALLVSSSSAFAAGTVSTGGSGLLISLFVGFFALILVCQLVPASLMFIGMVKGLLSGKTQVHY